MEFQDACKDYQKFLLYVQETILKPFKKKSVRAWTYLVLHLGCRTMNIVEGAHCVVKEYLSTSKGDLGTCWQKIDVMLANQFGEIQSSFGRSIRSWNIDTKMSLCTLGWGVTCLDKP